MTLAGLFLLLQGKKKKQPTKQNKTERTLTKPITQLHFQALCCKRPIPKRLQYLASNTIDSSHK